MNLIIPFYYIFNMMLPNNIMMSIRKDATDLSAIEHHKNNFDKCIIDIKLTPDDWMANRIYKWAELWKCGVSTVVYMVYYIKRS
jgi:hypothetical protein